MSSKTPRILVGTFDVCRPAPLRFSPLQRIRFHQVCFLSPTSRTGLLYDNTLPFLIVVEAFGFHLLSFVSVSVPAML